MKSLCIGVFSVLLVTNEFQALRKLSNNFTHFYKLCIVSHFWHNTEPTDLSISPRDVRHEKAEIKQRRKDDYKEEIVERQVNSFPSVGRC